jgi:hypothetical protein
MSGKRHDAHFRHMLVGYDGSRQSEKAVEVVLVGILDAQGIARPEPFIPVSRSLHIGLTFIKIAAEELHPKYMRGYGQISPAAATDLNRITSESVGLTAELERYVTSELDGQVKPAGESLTKIERNTTT